MVITKNFEVLKFTFSIFCLSNFLFFSFSTFAQQGKQITLSNPANYTRKDELVVLKRSNLEKQLGPIAKYVKVIARGKGQVVQFDDLNGDGKWDEAVILYSFQPKEKLVLTVAPGVTTNTASASVRAHVRLRKKKPDDSWGPNITKEQMPYRNPATDFSKQPLPPYLTEGPAWENDKVGFRLYFDVRNGKDIWGKRTSRMVMDSVGTKVEPTYHDLHDWGMDILHVGSSLGAGSLALLVPIDNSKDTLIRLGGQNVKRTVYEQLADGPLRAVFQITYDWEINGKPVKIKEQTSIWGGQYFYESKVWLSGVPKGTKLVSGIASFYDNVFQAYQTGGISVVFSYGPQSENKDNLGMAILVPSTNFSFAGTAPNSASDIMNTYLAAQDIKEKEPCRFRFISAWEKSDQRFAKLKEFKAFVNEQAMKMKEAIVVKYN